jgi:hypothetical protein
MLEGFPCELDQQLSKESLVFASEKRTKDKFDRLGGWCFEVFPSGSVRGMSVWLWEKGDGWGVSSSTVLA